MRIIKITKPVYDLYQQLERLEDVLEFSVFYPFSRAFESHHFLPGFTFDGSYYEIQDDSEEVLNVVQFHTNSLLGAMGYKMYDEDIFDLIENLKSY